MGVEKNGRAEDEREKTTGYHVVAVLVSFLDLRLNPNLRSIIQPACNYERCCSISARKSAIQDVGKALFEFFLPWKSVESMLFRNVQREVIHTSGCLSGFLIRAPTSTGAGQGGGLRGPAAAGGPCRLWERAASGGQLDAASGHKREGMKPPEASCY